MSLPSFDTEYRNGQFLSPRVQILEIFKRDNVDGDPIAWVLVERTEKYEYNDGKVYRGSIQLSYQQIAEKYNNRMAGKGQFEGSYNRHACAVSLSSSSLQRGAIFLDLPGLEGHRIGTYLMSEIVKWTCQWPDAEVQSIELLKLQASEKNKERRNRFYEQFGLVFDYVDASREAGRSRSIKVSELVQVETWKRNIRERSVLDYIGEVIYKQRFTAIELEFRDRACKDLIQDRKRLDDMPIRWALKQSWHRMTGRSIVYVFAVVVVVFYVWLKPPL